MKVSHTKGKWLISPPWSVHTDDGMMIADCGRSNVLPDRQMTANTRLVAAAPDMLAALEEVMRAHGIYDQAVSSSLATRPAYTEIFLETGDKIRAAISKAKGEA